MSLRTVPVVDDTLLNRGDCKHKITASRKVQKRRTLIIAVIHKFIHKLSTSYPQGKKMSAIMIARVIYACGPARPALSYYYCLLLYSFNNSKRARARSLKVVTCWVFLSAPAHPLFLVCSPSQNRAYEAALTLRESRRDSALLHPAPCE